MMSKFTNLCLSTLFVICFCSCSYSTAPEDFTFRYRMDNIHQFKVEFQIDPDSTWRIDHNNYFFDKFEGKANPLYMEGKLGKEDWDRFAKLISSCKLDYMDDSYGFGMDIDDSIVYMVELTRKGKSKFVAVNAGTEVDLPDEFIRLVAFTGKFISDQMRLIE